MKYKFTGIAEAAAETADWGRSGCYTQTLLDVRSPEAPLEPRANALAADGGEVEVYWFFQDAEQPISEDAINGILPIEEEEWEASA